METNRRKKVLFLSITAGQGHNSASNAVVDSLSDNKNITCRLLDTYKYLSTVIGTTLDKGYVVQAKYNRKALAKMCIKHEKVTKTKSIRTYFPFLFAEVTRKKMARYVNSYDPDIIVCPHVLTAIIMTQLHKYKLLKRNVPVIAINTDYTSHVFWEFTDADYFVQGADFLVEDFVHEGVERERSLPLGLPIKREFENPPEKSAARVALGLVELKTVLAMSGGMGMVNLREVALDLDDLGNDYQIVVICGKNKAQFRKLTNTQFKNPNIKIVGFTDKVRDYMAAADIVYTKPGGLSTTEALISDRPLLLMEPLPGVEEANVAYLAGSGLAAITNKYFSGRLAIKACLEDETTLKRMADARARLIIHNAADNIAKKIVEIVSE